MTWRNWIESTTYRCEVLLDQLRQALRGEHDDGDSNSLILEELEDRVLLSASPLPVNLPQAIDAADSLSATAPTPTPTPTGDGSTDQADSGLDALTAQAMAEDRFEETDFADLSTTAGTGQDSGSESSIDTDQLETIQDTEAGPTVDTNPLVVESFSERREVVFVNADVLDVQKLVDDLRQPDSDATQFDVVLLDRHDNGIQQISAALKADSDTYDAIHIVSHGSANGVLIGGTWLTADRFANFQSEVAQWRDAMTAGADLLIYGCDLASSEQGRALLDALSSTCDCDVAASVDDTGQFDMGGDWELEYQIGTIESEIPFSHPVQNDFRGLLATFTVTNTSDSGAGSLRQAITDANALPGTDTIAFSIGSGPQTITPSSALPFILDAVFIDGTTQPGFSGTPIIELNGASAGSNTIGINLLASGSTVQGLVINRFTSYGIAFNADSSGHTVVGNYIGTDVAGTAALPNAHGVSSIFSTGGNTIGGSTPALRNVISGNSGIGVGLVDGDNNIVIGNYIGVGADGTTALGNDRNIYISNSNDHTIGGTAAGVGNIIANATQYGVRVFDGTGHLISGNSIYGNGDLGIDLDPAGVTANDVGDVDTGANNLQNFPVLTHAATGGSQINIRGTFNGAASSTFTIEYFSSSTADGSGYGEGEVYLGSDSFVTDGSGDGTFDTTLAVAVTPGDTITATVTDASDNTSEFSAGVTAFQGVVVDTTTDVDDGTTTSIDALLADRGADGFISLREAIDATNNTGNTGGNPDEIHFDIGGGGQQTIAPTAELPSIDDALLIDGRTQGGFAGTPLIELDGQGVVATVNAGLLIDASNTTIHSLSVVGWNDDGIQLQSGVTNSFILGNYVGLRPDGTTVLANDDNGVDVGGDNNTIGGTGSGERNVISGNVSDGIELENGGANNTTIIGNYIGTDAGGTLARPNRSGIRVMSGAHTNTIGGATTAERNVISGNTDHGVNIEDAGTDDNVVLGNFIGVNADGDTALANGLDGVYIQNGAQDNIIGGTVSGSGNVISGNTGSGVHIDNSGTDGNQVLGNFIGTDLGGTIDLGNQGSGVRIEDDADNNVVGTTASDAGNTIAFNDQDGVRILDSNNDGNSIRGNSIFSNDQLGIDLDTDGVTANDSGDSDSGANEEQNFPVLSTAVSSGGDTTITGSLNSLSATTFSIDFYSSPSGDEGRVYLGSDNVTTTGNDASINTTLIGVSVTAGHVVTATATDPSGNTSEFSAPVAATAGQTISGTVYSDEGTTPLGSQTVRVAINGTDFGTTAESDAGSGAYSIGGLSLNSGDVITIYLEDETANAVTVTVSDGNTLSGGDLYQDYLITRHDNGGSLTNVHLNTALIPGEFDIGDIYALFSGNLVMSTSSELLIPSGHTFAPGTNATVHNIDIDGTFDASGSQVFVNGDWNNTDGSATLDQTVTFNGSGSQTIITGGVSGGKDFEVIAVSGSGTVRVSTDNLLVNQTLSLTGGTLEQSNGVTITATNFTQSNGTFTGGDSAITATDSFTLTAGTFNSTSATFSVGGDWTISGTGSFVHNNGAVVLNGSGQTMRGSATFYDLSKTVAAADTLTFESGSTQTIASGGSLTLNGASGQMLTLAPIAASDWLLDVDGTASQSISYVDVSASDASGGAQILANNGSNNDGSGNTNWLFGPTTITVDTTADENDGDTSTVAALIATPGGTGISLREAIIAANNTANVGGPDEIQFDISGGGPHSIALLSSLPAISEAVIVDGWSEPDFTTTPIIELNGAAAGASDGLRVDAVDVTIRGLVINRFNGDGIAVNANNATIQGNYIGTDVAGTSAGGNADDGISIASSSGHQIGGTTSGEGNIIAANLAHGIRIAGAASTGIVIEGNFIGTDLGGTINLGNATQGIYSTSGANNNTIGGTAAGAGNTIAFSGGRGVRIDSGTGNAIRGNSIHSNSDIGIDIDAGGVTANDVGDGDTGANNVQNFPVLSAAISSGGSTTVTGSLNSEVSSTYDLDFFSSPTGDPSGNGEGAVYLGSDSVTTDGSGNATISAVLPLAVASGQLISATATDSSGNTSEFAANVTIVSNIAVVDTVSDVLDGDTSSISALYGDKGADGFISLREAITAANNTANGVTPDEIEFNIPGAGPHTIVLSSQLPDITDAVILDGSTEPDFAGTPIIELDGTGAGGAARGLQITGGGTTIRGLVINRFGDDGINITTLGGNTIVGNYIGTNVAGTAALANGGDGVELAVANNVIGGTNAADQNVISGNSTHGIYLDNSDNNTIIGNLIGTDAAGTAAVANTVSGIRLDNGSSGNTIGGSSAAERNIISGNSQNGVSMDGVGTSSNVVSGNYIGLDVNGTAALGNGNEGVVIANGASGNTVGGSSAGERNIISANNAGVAIPGVTPNNNIVIGNYIGTDVTGTLDRGNLLRGVLIANGNNNRIGGTAALDSNLIAFNEAYGIEITAGTGNAILGNSIRDNDDQGIQLSGYTVNDVDDVDAGANDLLNAPVLTNVTQVGPDVDIDFAVDLPAGDYRIEFFDNAGGLDGSGFGEGETFVGFASITVVGAAGYESFSTTITSLTPSDVTRITVTATEDLGGGNFGSSSEFGPQFLGAGTLVVDTTSDTADGDTTSIAALLGDRGADGFISLREALTAANNTANIGGTPDEIRFDIAGAGPYTISPTSALPNITEAVMLDGTSEPDYGGTPIVELDGSGAGASVDGLRLIGGSSTITGLVINGFDDDGIEVVSNGNTIVGNYIGTNVAGAAAVGNTDNGIDVLSANNVIGGTSSADRNLISGNQAGIRLSGGGAVSNQILGNYIGTDATGTAAVGNSADGIALTSGADGNTIGGTVTGAGNLLSGNGQQGLDINSSFNTIQGNLIGTDAAGTSALSNSSTGVRLANAASNNIIGGAASGARNVISGNMLRGIRIGDAGTSGNQILGNYIGTDVTGAAPLGNQSHGIRIVDNASDNIIGGVATGEGNVIAHNGADGITTNNLAGTGNLFIGNSIHSNVGLGIDLDNNNADTNDAGDPDVGPNNFQNYPVLASAVTTGGDTTITGTLNSAASTAFDIHFYSSSSGDASGFGEGEVYLGTDSVTTDGSGNATINTTLASVSLTAGHVVTATATDPSDNTSEFSAVVTASSYIVTVDTTSDVSDGDTSSISNLAASKGADGFISLREAIAAVNNTANGTVPDEIHFEIPGAGPHTIQPTTALPDITEAVIIDGTTESDFVSVPVIVVDGSLAGLNDDGLRLVAGSDGSTIRGLAINHFLRDGLVIEQSDGNTIVGNYLGLDVDGTTAAGNSRGILVDDSESNAIGSTSAADRNYISGNFNEGIVFTFGSIANTVQGNYVGLGDNGTTAVGNLGTGIVLSAASNNTIGGTAAGAGNVISGNSGYGVELNAASGNSIAGNFIGTGAAGAADRGNTLSGVYLHNGASSNTIGGIATAEGNLISGNEVGGVTIEDAATSNNLVQFNYIGTNATGMAAIGNTVAGVIIFNAPNNTIGGSLAGVGLRNLISGNTGDGISIRGASSTNNTIQANYIGVNAVGTGALGNGTRGISLQTGASNNLIGGTATYERNVISGNSSDGIGLISSGTDGNTIQGNYIGTDVSGSAAIANGIHGVRFTTNASNNVVGGVGAGESNLIAFNTLDGVRIASGTGNSVRGNAIHSSGDLGIDIGSDGVNANDLGDGDSGANNLQNYPVLSSADSSGGVTTIVGTLNSAASTTFSVDFYASAVADTSGYGEGEVYLGSATLTTDGLGDVAFTEQFAVAVSAGEVVTATATDPADNTSEFSATVVATAGNPTLLVNTVSDVSDGDTSSIANLIANKGADGFVSLREAITAANNTANAGPPDQVAFDLPGAGVQTINVLSALPTITDAILIDGTSEPDYVSTPVVELNGASAGAANGLSLSGPGSDGSAIRGVLVNRFGLSGISMNDSDNNEVSGSVIGTDVGGTVDLGNGLHGILLVNGSANNQIGGTLPTEPNTIAFNNANGVAMDSGAASGNLVLGNSIYANSGLGIGLNADGVTANDLGDADSGPNDLQNYPVLASATTDGIDVTIQGTLNSVAATTYRIEYFASGTGDVSGFGEAERFLGFDSVTTDGSGNATLNTTIGAAVTSGELITATATDSAGSTSEFAANVTAISPPVLDLDADNSAGAGGIDFAAAFVEDAGPVAVADNDAALTDADSATLNSLLVTITNLQDGVDEVLSADTSGTSIAAGYAGGVLTLSGSETVAGYEQVLRTVSYDNASQNPNPANRLITFVASDGTYSSSVATTTLSVTGVNDIPIVVDDAHITDINEAVSESAPGVLANDSDADGVLTASLITGPSDGVLVFNADGSFTYTPNDGFVGIDSFVYQASDGVGGTATGTVSIDVRSSVGPIIGDDGSDDSGGDDSDDSIPDADDDGDGDSSIDDDSGDDDGDVSEISDDAEEEGHYTEEGPPGDEGSDRRRNARQIEADFQYVRLEEQLLQIILGVPRKSVATSREVLFGLLADASRDRSVVDAYLGGSFDVASLKLFEDAVSRGSLWTQFDAVRSEAETVFAGWKPISVGTAVVSTVSAGYLMWALRSGYLLVGLATSAPAWTQFDPLPILNSPLTPRDDEGESLHDIIANGR